MRSIFPRSDNLPNLVPTSARRYQKIVPPKLTDMKTWADRTGHAHFTDLGGCEYFFAKREEAVY